MNGKLQSSSKPNFGTAPVFLTSVSTILGAILFLRFGYAVGHVGFFGALAVIVVGHFVTIPTAMAIAEIATNQRVEGGGEYYIISRSFGIIIGAAIGMALYVARAISVAFYIIAFAEAFRPVFTYLQTAYGFSLQDLRLVSVPTLILLTYVILTRGANVGMKALYLVASILFLSLVMFFFGKTDYQPVDGISALFQSVDNPDALFLVFAICFPAFTGMTAGVGLSGDLRDPRRSIPLGTMAATLVGMVVYVLIAYKLSISASPEDLASDQLIMSRIAVWGPIIPLGLAAATLSSAIGSYLAAPRTLQAIAGDQVFPWPRLNSWLSKVTDNHEPVNSAVITGIIAFVFVVIGDVNFVAQIISMFFMITYGSICTVSFLEHFAADPSYRPSFRSRWYISFFGAVMCLWLMFQMSQFYAFLSIVVMFLLYFTVSRYNEDKRGLSKIVQGAIFQVSRQLQVFLQKSRKQEQDNWRPSVVCISKASFQRHAAFDLLRWISHRYGFGTYIHHVEDYVSSATHAEAEKILQRLVQLADQSVSNVYVDTIISPSYRTAITQLMQLPGVSGKENNMVLFEFSKTETDELAPVVDNYQLVAAMNFDVCILASCDRGFGYCREIHLVLSPGDYDNASLMILLAYILVGHPEWKGAVIKVFSLLPVGDLETEKESLSNLIRSGRIPISANNVEVVPLDVGMDRRSVINERCRDADLTIVGFQGKLLKRQKTELFEGYDDVGNLLFVNTQKEIELIHDEEEPSDETALPAETSQTAPSQLSPESEEAAKSN